MSAAPWFSTNGANLSKIITVFLFYLSLVKQSYPEYWPQYSTATIYQWKHLLEDNNHKDIIINSLKYLVTEKRIVLDAFVIMSAPIHLIWQPMFGFTPSDIQASFMRYTARQLKRLLLKIKNLSWRSLR